jgi:hypothetical protein
LRAVAANEKPPVKTKPLTLAQAVETGDYLKILIAQRHEIAEAIPDEKGPAKAALHRQLSIVAKEIEAIEASNARSEESESHANVQDGKFEAEAI